MDYAFDREIEDEDGNVSVVAVVCRVYYTPPVPGRTRGHPDTWTPEEGPEMDIEDARIEETGEPTEVTAREFDRILEALTNTYYERRAPRDHDDY